MSSEQGASKGLKSDFSEETLETDEAQLYLSHVKRANAVFHEFQNVESLTADLVYMTLDALDKGNASNLPSSYGQDFVELVSETNTALSALDTELNRWTELQVTDLPQEVADGTEEIRSKVRTLHQLNDDIKHICESSLEIQEGEITSLNTDLESVSTQIEEKGNEVDRMLSQLAETEEWIEEIMYETLREKEDEQFSFLDLESLRSVNLDAVKDIERSQILWAFKVLLIAPDGIGLLGKTIYYIMVLGLILAPIQILTGDMEGLVLFVATVSLLSLTHAAYRTTPEPDSADE